MSEALEKSKYTPDMNFEKVLNETRIKYENIISKMEIEYNDEKQDLFQKIKDLKEKLRIKKDDIKNIDDNGDDNALVSKLVEKDETIIVLENSIDKKNEEILKLRKLTDKNNLRRDIEVKKYQQRVTKLEEMLRNKDIEIERLQSKLDGSLYTPPQSPNTSKKSSKKKSSKIFKIFKKKERKKSSTNFFTGSVEEKGNSIIDEPLIPFNVKTVDTWDESNVQEWLKEIVKVGDIFNDIIVEKKITGKKIKSLDPKVNPLLEKEFFIKIPKKSEIKVRINLKQIQRVGYVNKNFSYIITKLLEKKGQQQLFTLRDDDLDDLVDFGLRLSSEENFVNYFQDLQKKSDKTTKLNHLKIVILDVNYFLKMSLPEFVSTSFTPIDDDIRKSKRIETPSIKNLRMFQLHSGGFSGGVKFYSGLLIGDILLEFNETELIYPRRITSPLSLKNALIIDIPEEIKTKDKCYELIISQFCTKINLHPKKKKKINCQTFIDDILSQLKIYNYSSSKGFEKTILKYLKKLKKNGVSNELPLELKDILKWVQKDIWLWLKIIDVRDYFEKDLSLNETTFFKEGNLGSVMKTGDELLRLSYRNQLWDTIKNDQNKKLFLVNLCHIKNEYDDTNCPYILKKSRKKKRKLKFSRDFSVVARKIFREHIDMDFKALEYFITCLSGKTMLIKNYLKKKLHQNDYFVKVSQIQDKELKFINSYESFNTSSSKNEKNTPTLKVKIIITEIAFTKKEKIIRSLISPMMNKIPIPTMNQNFGLFHTAILIGPWYLEWTKTEVVIPKRISSANALLSFDVDTLDIFDGKIDNIIDKIADIIIKWNTKMKYTKAKGLNKGNCQDFIDDVTKELKIDARIEKGTIFSKFLDEMRKKGTSQIHFTPTQRFIKFFKLAENKIFDRYKVESGTNDGEPKYNVTFQTHSELDDFVHELSDICLRDSQETIAKQFPWEIKLLKSFDRAFWLRYIKSNEKITMYGPSMKTIKYGSVRKCGCPFLDPRDTFSYA